MDTPGKKRYEQLKLFDEYGFSFNEIPDVANNEAQALKGVYKNGPVIAGTESAQLSKKVGESSKKTVLDSGRIMGTFYEDLPIGLSPEERAQVYFKIPENKRPPLSFLTQEDREAIDLLAYEQDQSARMASRERIGRAQKARAVKKDTVKINPPKKTVLDTGRKMGTFYEDLPIDLSPEERARAYFKIPENKRPPLSWLSKEDRDAIDELAYEQDRYGRMASRERIRKAQKAREVKKDTAKINPQTVKKAQEGKGAAARVVSNPKRPSPTMDKIAQRGKKVSEQIVDNMSSFRI